MRQLSTWSFIALASLAMGLASCSWQITKKEPVRPDTIYHEVDEHATVVPAKYDREYTLSGNMVARYPDFDLALVKTIHVPKEAATHNFYEIRNHDGFLLAAFQVGPNLKAETSVVKVARYNYHFAPGRTQGSIIIYLPYEQMAAHSRQLHSKNRTHT